MKKVSLIVIGCLFSVIVFAQNYTAVYQNKSDVWKIYEGKIHSVFTLSLNNSELAEVKSKLDPLAKEVGYSVTSKDNKSHELTLQFLEGADPRYLTKMLVFIGVEKCLVENEQVEVYTISTLIE